MDQEELREIRRTLQEHDLKLNALLKVMLGHMEQSLEFEALISDIAIVLDSMSVPMVNSKQSNLN
jgi:hypothetical protein